MVNVCEEGDSIRMAWVYSIVFKLYNGLIKIENFWKMKSAITQLKAKNWVLRILFRSHDFMLPYSKDLIN